VIRLKKIKLRKTGQIYLSKNITKILNIKVGDFIIIYLDGIKIVLTSKEGFEHENKCTYSQSGTVHIPTEIRRLSNINSDTFFSVTINEKEKQICLIPDYSKI
jgi:bifunctional DNA-binding transcriptional regulator/antitoxin component of YhaV-PrlF toxin-antitoxin module